MHRAVILLFHILSIIILCWHPIECSIEPSYKVIQNLLHERIEQIFNNDDDTFRHFKIPVGQVFKYDLLNNANDIYEVVESGRTNLPAWLTFESERKRLVGVPTESDIISGLKIEFHASANDELNGVAQANNYIMIDVQIVDKDPLTCINAEGVAVASIIFDDDFLTLRGDKRFKLIKSLAREFDKKKKDFVVEIGNKMEEDLLYSSRIRVAGPGDKVLEQKAAFTVSFVIDCSYDIAGDNREIRELQSYSEKEDFSNLSDIKVFGWYVSTAKTNRPRRAIGSFGTPGLTPTVSVPSGTPTLGPSPTTAVRPTEMVKPTPSKSVSVTTSPPAPPVTDKPTTTTVPTTQSTTEETTKESTTKETTTSTVESTAAPHTTPAPNYSPEVINKIGTINVFENQGLLHSIPSNVFFDRNGDAISIELKYLRDGSTKESISAGFWMEYVNKALYMFPTSRDIGEHTFSLVATDPYGAYVDEMFKVYVQRDDVQTYSNVFNVTIDRDYTQINKSVQRKVELIQTVSTAMGLDDLTEIRAVKFIPGSVTVQWGIEDLKNADCNEPLIAVYMERVESNEFKSSFAPDDVLSSGSVERKECVVVSDTSKDDGGLLKRILIPVIIVIVVIIIIIIVLCCVCRKRKYKKAPVNGNEDDGVYLGHKKPIIFQEEYDEKTSFVSLTPTTLPHEKPPISNNYNESSDGPGSSTSVSTENEEKTLLNPGSPKDSRQTFNSPPPYGA